MNPKKAYERDRARKRQQHATQVIQAGGPVPGSYRPAYGTYDPILDQQERSANRGLGYLVGDSQKTMERATVDYGLGKDQIGRQSGRSLADLLTARERAQQDYGTQTADLTQNYSRLANTQRQQTNAAGVLGGAIEQARIKRTANQAHDQAGIDTNYNRFIADNTKALQRTGEDTQSALGNLLLGLQRTGEDTTSDVKRAKTENVFYGQDINELRVDQAKQTGLLPTGGSQHPSTKPPVPKKRKRRPISDGGSPGIGRLY